MQIHRACAKAAGHDENAVWIKKEDGDQQDSIQNKDEQSFNKANMNLLMMPWIQKD